MNMQKQVNRALERYVPKDGKLFKAMRYSVFAGGKRFRPTLTLLVSEILGGKTKEVMPAACAIEMIHTFTLIHDDLPAMDNSDLRRGKPACHKVFSEALAILAGDALNTLAFETIARYCPPAKAHLVSKELASALLKVVKGQVLDLESEGKKINLKKLKEIHLNKTAALIEACVKIGAILANARKKELRALSRYGRNLGLAFQIADDILDVTSSAVKLGKPAKADAKKLKSTYPSIAGLFKAQMIAKRYIKRALAAVEIIGKKAKLLKQLAYYTVRREA